MKARHAFMMRMRCDSSQESHLLTPTLYAFFQNHCSSDTVNTSCPSLSFALLLAWSAAGPRLAVTKVWDTKETDLARMCGTSPR